MGSSGWTLPVISLAVCAALVGYIVQLRGEIDSLENQLAAAQTAASAPPPVAQEPPPAEAAPKAAAAPTAAAPADSQAPARTISEKQRTAMIDTLSVGGYNAGSPVWFATIPNNPEAAAFEKQLESVFTDAGWVVKGNKPIGFNMKAGIYIFAADELPPEYINDVNNALIIAGIPVASNGRGYREYYKERKAANPDWIGFDMDDDQSFVLAIGRNPDT